MPKIGVLTFHNNENRGAILQAYALCNVLEDTFQRSVELVEYRTSSKERSRRRKIVLSRQPQKVFRRVKDRRIAEQFMDTELPTNSELFVSDDHSAAVEWLKEQKYDMLVTGSDEIWKVQNRSGANFFLRFIPPRPFPNLYFLDPSLTATKIAYAASGNKTDLDKISKDEINTLKHHLTAYDAISVRDRHTEQLVKELDIKDVKRVPDPTLMTEIPNGDAVSVLQEEGVNLNNPILGFHGPDSPLFMDICEKYRDKGYQIVTTRSSRFADVELEGVVDPFEYYAMYAHFNMVVTNSLHSTIFSLKHGTPFVTIDVSDKYSNHESKTYSLLRDFELLERHIDAVDGDISEFYKNQSEIEAKPDRSHIENRIFELQKQGYEFLEMVKHKHETDD